MDQETVSYNDISYLGLRRLHVIRGGQAVEQERWEQVAFEEGGEIQARYAWVDDLGMHHLMLAWRCWMNPMWVMRVAKPEGVEGWMEAIGRAAEMYWRRNGEWPNRALVRAGTQAPVEIAENGVVVMDRDERVVGVIKLEEVRFMRPGDVGVTVMEGPGDE